MKATTALALILLVGGAWHAPVQGQQQQGDLELQFSGSIFSTVGRDGGSLTAGLVQSKVGYFVSDRVQIGAFPSVVFSSATVENDLISETVSDTRFGLGVFGTYSFLAEDASTVPYLGGQLYRIDLTDEDETGWAGVNAGVKLYLNRTTAFDMGGNFLVGLGQSDGSLVLFQVGLDFLL